ncbi:hypothetical protein GEMRC1_012467 [Eukaryota sp. GEM-RC1]
MPPKASKPNAKPKRNLRGLQKLKFYCQVCEKQCKDANAFDNHCQSESHIRNMELFSQNQDKQISDYSTQFETSFLTALRGNFGTKKVDANHVYNLLIRDKSHVHLNSTRWTSLSGFLQSMARAGKVVIEPHPVKGWWVSFVDQVAIERDQRGKELEEFVGTKSYSERLMEVATAKTTEVTGIQLPKMDVVPEKEDEGGLEIDLNGWLGDEDGGVETKKEVEKEVEVKDVGKRSSAVMTSDCVKFKKLRNDCDDDWFVEGSIVLITDQKISKYFNERAVIRKVNGRTAEVKLLDKKGRLLIDRVNLNPVD